MHQPEEQQRIEQAAAIPVRRNRATGRLEVLLIRRVGGGEWGIPKGHIDPGLSRADAAAMEAHEEAGVVGEVDERPLGSFTYEKNGSAYTVHVFALRVTQTQPHWKEEAERERQWFDADEAVGRVGREAVGRMIRKLGVKMEDR